MPMMRTRDENLVYKDFHFFCGSGGGALGFQRSAARVGNLTARFRSLGGIDVNPQACADFTRLVGVPASCVDLFDEAQYRQFHGHAPPAGWRPATYHDIRQAMGFENPDVVFLSPPCKGFSGLLSRKSAKSRKYQALNRLVPRTVHLLMQACGDDPPSLILIENVPRIQQRGRPLLDEVIELLHAYGYAVAETTHDCGELGGLAQHRRRFLLVARHRDKVANYLYEPPRKRVRAVGEILDRLPLPEHPAFGPMHQCPRLQWRTWMRLALIPAGGDWRSLQDLPWERYRVERYGTHHGKMRVESWEGPTHTVTGSDRVGSGALSIADPRVPGGGWHHGALGIQGWDRPTNTVTGGAAPSSGRFSVADPRVQGNWHAGILGVVPYDAAAGTVKGRAHPTTGAHSVADPRQARYSDVYRVTDTGDPDTDTVQVADPRNSGWGGGGKYRVTRYDEASGAVIAASTTGNGAFALADPRAPRELGRYCPYGVLPYTEAAGTVTSQAAPGAGVFSVADPRVEAAAAEGRHEPLRALPSDKDRPDPVPVIVSLDGTWHRPFTTLELAALQGFPVLQEDFDLEGSSHTSWRERIGNAVPVDAAEAVGSSMLHCMLLQEAGQSFALSETPIWVQPIAVALSMDRVRPELDLGGAL